MKLPRLERGNYHGDDQLQIFGTGYAPDFVRRLPDRGWLHQISPSFIFPVSLIMCWFQGGSQTNSTDASSTPEIDRILSLASWAMAGPIPHPGAVKVIFTSTRVPVPGDFVT
jgi:hypothetical protein